MEMHVVGATSESNQVSIKTRKEKYPRIELLLTQTRSAWPPSRILPSTGFFFGARRTPHDSNGPQPGCAEENGIGICESLSQWSNYSKTIRLARRNHKPGGADLAGSGHVVRSLSG